MFSPCSAIRRASDKDLPVQNADKNMVSLPTTVKVDPAAMRVTSLSAIVLTTCGQDLQIKKVF